MYVNGFRLHGVSSPSTMQILGQKQPDVKESQARSRTPAVSRRPYLRATADQKSYAGAVGSGAWLGAWFGPDFRMLPIFRIRVAGNTDIIQL